MIESSEKKAKTRAPREIFPHDSHENAIPWVAYLEVPHFDSEK